RARAVTPAAALHDDGADVAVPGRDAVGAGAATANDDDAEDRGRAHVQEHSLICMAKSRYWAWTRRPARWARTAMTLDRRQFLKSSLSGAAALAGWGTVPTLARARGPAELMRRTDRPPNSEGVRSTSQARH